MWHNVSMRLPSFLKRNYHPVREIEWVIVFTSLIQFIYVVSPLYQHSVAVNGLTPFAAALASPVLLYAYASGLAVSALIISYGIIKKSATVRSNGLFFQFLLRLFNVLTTILAAGFLPLYWIHAVTVMLVTLLLWVHERSQLYRDA